MPHSFPPDLMSILRTTRSVVVLTGAGISAESGVPTFRDAQTGLWAKYRPEDLATPEAFERDPEVVIEWYAWRHRLVSKALPNPGHYALARMAKRFADFTLITQNVDGLHQRAGSPRVIELHGNIHRIKCAQGCGVIDDFDHRPEHVPRCERCGALLRPDVVWFGENLPQAELMQAEAATRQCEVFFSIGTSTQVYPAAELPFMARRAGALVIEINPDRTPLTLHADHVLQGPAGEILPELLSEVEADD